MSERVTVVEVGPRDGLQNEAAVVPAACIAARTASAPAATARSIPRRFGTSTG